VPQGLLPDWLQAVLMIVFLAAIIALTIQQASEMKKIRERASRRPRIVVEVECEGGVQRRGFAEGDYVGKPVDCPSGEGQGRITRIYAEEEKEEKQGPVKKLSPARPQGQ